MRPHNSAFISCGREKAAEWGGALVDDIFSNKMQRISQNSPKKGVKHSKFLQFQELLADANVVHWALKGL